MDVVRTATANGCRHANGYRHANTQTGRTDFRGEEDNNRTNDNNNAFVTRVVKSLPMLLDVDSVLFPGRAFPSDLPRDCPLYNISADLPAIVVNNGSPVTLLWFHGQSETVLDVFRIFQSAMSTGTTSTTSAESTGENPNDTEHRNSQRVPNLVCPEYRGYGIRSHLHTRETSTSSEEMGRVALDYAKLLSDRVVIVGYGIGSGVACYLASRGQKPPVSIGLDLGLPLQKRRPKEEQKKDGGKQETKHDTKQTRQSFQTPLPCSFFGLVLVNPFLSVKQLVYERYGIMTAFIKQRFDNSKNLKQYNGRLVIAAGVQDDRISYLHSMLLYQQAKCSTDKHLSLREDKGHGVDALWWAQLLSPLQADKSLDNIFRIWKSLSNNDDA